MCISDLSGCNLIGLASSLSILLAQGLTPDEIGVLAAFFTSVGDNLALIAINPPSSTQNESQKDDLGPMTL